MSHSTRRSILHRHRHSLRGELTARYLHSAVLGIRKPYYVYEPPYVEERDALPALYLFRGHEREWVNFEEDHSRIATTAIEDLDRSIVAGQLPPVLAVMPGLSSANNHIPSLGINMVGKPWQHRSGLGSGRFWDFLTRELFPKIERRYPSTTAGPRLAAGFSLGGYTASLLAAQHPGYFDHIGIFDGLFMWPGHLDPRIAPKKPFNDRVWVQNPLFDAAFGAPRSHRALNDWNPTDLLIDMPAIQRNELIKTTWWIACATADGNQGNRDRAAFFSSLIRDIDLPLGLDSIFFDDLAAHTWHWADRFLIDFLKRTLS